MKTHSLINLALAAVLTFVLTPKMRAGTNTVIQPRISGQQVHVDISQWDLNKSGQLNSTELQAFRQAMLQQRIQRFQAQRSAAIQMRRVQLEHQGIPTRVPAAVLQQYDLNKNGVLDADEWAKYLADQSLKQGKIYPPPNRFGPDARIVTPPAKPAAH